MTHAGLANELKGMIKMPQESHKPANLAVARGSLPTIEANGPKHRGHAAREYR